MKGLFHVHSDYSYDGRESLGALAQFCEKKQFGFIALAEHAESLDETIMQTYVSECRRLSDGKILLLPGLEFGFRKYPDLHLLGIGIQEYIAGDDISTVIDEIHKQNGLAVIAHPSRNKHFVPGEITKKIDGIEIWNAAYDSRYLPHNGSLELFTSLKRENKGLIAFGGLDMHEIAGFREITININRPVGSEEDLVALLKNGEFTTEAKLINMSSRPDVSTLLPLLVKGGRAVLNILDAVYWKMKRSVNGLS